LVKWELYYEIMSFCESGICLRGMDRSMCPGGRVAEIEKIINQWKNRRLDIWFAGEEWKDRGFRKSSREEQDSDYYMALKKKIVLVCEEIESRDK
jgi:hypothetical protein